MDILSSQILGGRALDIRVENEIVYTNIDGGLTDAIDISNQMEPVSIGAHGVADWVAGIQTSYSSGIRLFRKDGEAIEVAILR